MDQESGIRIYNSRFTNEEVGGAVNCTSDYFNIAMFDHNASTAWCLIHIFYILNSIF